MKILFVLPVFVIFYMTKALPTKRNRICAKEDLNVNLNVEKLAKQIVDVFNKQQCTCGANLSTSSSLSTIIQNKNEISFNALYSNLHANQIQEIDDGAELSIVWILYGKPEKAAERFNRIPDNIMYIKLIVDDILNDSPANMEKLLKFVDFVDGYQQKILMTMLLYKEFMKTIDVVLLPNFEVLVVNLMAMPGFKSLGNYYKEHFETMKSVIEVLMVKVEAFIPKEKPELINLEQMKETLDNLTESFREVKEGQLEMEIGQKDIAGGISELIRLLNTIDDKFENFTKENIMELKHISDNLQDKNQLKTLMNSSSISPDINQKTIDWRTEITSLKSDVKNNFMKLINIGLEIRNTENLIDNEQDLTELKLMLPETLRNLTSNEFNLFSCSYGMLYAVKPDEQIFSSSDYSDQKVASKLESLGDLTGNRWRLEMTDDYQSVYIKNIYTNEFLSAAESKHSTDSSYRKVSLAASPDYSAHEFMWTLAESYSSFYIINSKYWSEYLGSYSFSYENDNYAIATHSSSWIWQTIDC